MDKCKHGIPSKFCAAYGCGGYRTAPKPEDTVNIENAYTNDGNGTVLVNMKTADKLMALFNQRDEWTSAALNELLGWQFSQAVYALRRRGHNIVTRRIGPRQYAYRFVAPIATGVA